jgi:hypothetical protein
VIPLNDGTYAVVVVDVAEQPCNDIVQLELVITTGASKGEVIAVNASRLQRDAIELLGLPGTLTVDDGVPRVIIDG